MKIRSVRTHLLEHRLGTPFESASMRFDRRSHVLVEIECEDGTTGWGDCLGPAKPNAAVVAAYSNWLIGQIWAVLYNALRDQGQRGDVRLSLRSQSLVDAGLQAITAVTDFQ
jgi:D-galactarolactone cycloisomerase